MTIPGTEDQPLRVAIIGAGPAAFYAADYLLKQDDLSVEVDMFDRLPTPFGLVRGGVAPDHQNIKNVARVFHKTALKPGFRFFGNVEFGTDILLEDLRAHYHQIFYATGAQTDRSLGIPGEELDGSHSATEFVAWYNGHPDYRHLEFDLSAEKVVVVGVGNVAVDVARILCRTPEELAQTDIADYALDALRESNVQDVYMLGRRGPLQAAFTPPEVKELGEMEDADVVVLPDEAELDALSAEDLDAADRNTRRNVEIVQEFAARRPEGKPNRLHIRFLVSPVEILGDESAGVAGVRLVRNELHRNERGRLRPRATDESEELDVQLVFRSVGYQGVPLPDVPFNEDWHVILNERGRVLDPETRKHVVGEYVGGWIKRGPSGVIGTNKADSVETVECMLEDLEAGLLLDPPNPSAEAAECLISERQSDYISYEDWMRLDEIETTRGKEEGRPRVKFTSVSEMLEALDRSPHQDAA
ncbi:MAG: FAD-dependent oxidoreductase [Rhodothermales bacterium]